VYDRELVYSILDEGFVCHAACSMDGTVWMIPTAYARDGDRVLMHGAAANHVLRAAAGGAELTISVTLVDGLVLARSTFHHSINYRSVVIFGPATEISSPAAKSAALARIVEHMLPGRTAEARAPSPSELRQTRVLSVPLEEVSAKVRTGGPIDDPDDMPLPVWAGVLPLRLAAGQPEPARDQPGGWASQPGRFGRLGP
jgi:nitroimidazol reductase NimA-like FMN-containing flavoprotein (pyridoxamine 5'-phosphate oxidase superfamily)